MWTCFSTVTIPALEHLWAQFPFIVKLYFLNLHFSLSFVLIYLKLMDFWIFHADFVALYPKTTNVHCASWSLLFLYPSFFQFTTTSAVALIYFCFPIQVTDDAIHENNFSHECVSHSPPLLDYCNSKRNSKVSLWLVTNELNFELTS